MNTSTIFSNLCRVCLLSVEKHKSFPVDSVEEKSGTSYRQILKQWDADGKMLPEIEDQLPQRICRSCQRKVDDIIHFQLETTSNTKLLIAIAVTKQCGSLAMLESQLHLKNCRNTLHRMNLIKHVDASTTALIKELRKNLLPECDLEIKVESVNEIEDDGGVHQPTEFTEESIGDVCVETSDLQLKFELGEDVNDNPPAKKAKLDVKKRPCTIQDCEAVIIGQSLEHAKEKHRTYCKICGKVFALRAQALYHVAVHKPKDKRLRCEVCDKTFCRDYNLKSHMLELHNQTTPSYECALCEQFFQSKDDLDKHRELHLKSPCQFCDRKKPFASYKKLLEHYRLVHEKQIFKCEDCAACFLGRREYEAHRDKHLDGTFENCVEFAIRLWHPFTCSSCERTFYNEAYLQAHREKEHKVYKLPDQKNKSNTAEYKFKCNECDAKYRLKSSLKGHIFKNHRSAPKICKHCGASFKSNNEMDIHIRYIHTKDFPFKCDSCDKRCNTSSDLKAHRRTHTNERPFKCSYEGCDKDYRTKAGIVKHVRSVHTLERPFRCTYDGCGRGFVCSQQLKKHVLTHTQEKRFPCWYCDLRFSQNYLRRSHIRRHHPGQPDEAVQKGKDKCNDIKTEAGSSCE